MSETISFTLYCERRDVDSPCRCNACQASRALDALSGRIAELERELADERSEIERVLREYAVEVEMHRPNKGFSDYIECAADLVAERGESDE